MTAPGTPASPDTVPPMAPRKLELAADSTMLDHLTRIHGDLGEVKAELRTHGTRLDELAGKVDSVVESTASERQKDAEAELATYKAEKAQRAAFWRGVAEKALLFIVGAIASQLLANVAQGTARAAASPSSAPTAVAPPVVRLP